MSVGTDAAAKPTPPLAWLLAAFVVVWAMNTIEPVAHYFEHRWPLVSLGASVGIWAFVGAHGREPWGGRLSRPTWLLFSAYLLHGFEVDGVDLLGREFYFQAHVAATRGIELSAGDIMRMNTVTVWLGYACAIWGGDRFPWAGLAAAGATLANGLMHTTNTLLLGEYNPGLATSLVLFLPGATAYLAYAHRALALSGWAVVGAVTFGVVGHAASLPLIVALDTPLWLMSLLAVAPLLANAIVDAAGRARVQESTTSS